MMKKKMKYIGKRCRKAKEKCKDKTENNEEKTNYEKKNYR